MSHSGRILVADDEIFFLEATVKYLKSAGYEVESAPDAHIAASLLQKHEFDLLVSDIEMPGNQNLALLRGLPQLTNGLPVILVTGHPTFETAVQSIQLTVSAYLVKPVNPQDLLEEVRRSIERCRAFRAIQENRQRVQDWCHQLEQIESVTRTTQNNALQTPWNAFVTMTLQNIVESLLDLKRFSDLIGPDKTDAPAVPWREASQSTVLLQAIKETIEVLEKSRNQFKSKELGELRRRLENLLPTSVKNG